MARHLVPSFCFAAYAVALTLQGCGKQAPYSPDRQLHVAASEVTAADALPRRSAFGVQRTLKSPDRSPGVSVRPAERYPSDDRPPCLAELLHAPDPNVRIQGLDAWALEPGTSLDPVTYALVDSDESVRARAQEVFEQELARR